MDKQPNENFKLFYSKVPVRCDRETNICIGASIMSFSFTIPCVSLEHETEHRKSKIYKYQEVTNIAVPRCLQMGVTKLDKHSSVRQRK